MSLQPYLFYAGRCDEAIAFYEKALGAKATFLARYKDAPEKMPGPDGWHEKVMHANVSIGSSQFMMSDGMGPEVEPFKGFGLSLEVQTPAEGEQRLNALAEGGKVVMPFQKTFWSEGFGMVNDRFGVLWMLGIPEGK